MTWINDLEMKYYLNWKGNGIHSFIWLRHDGLVLCHFCVYFFFFGKIVWLSVVLIMKEESTLFCLSFLLFFHSNWIDFRFWIWMVRFHETHFSNCYNYQIALKMIFSFDQFFTAQFFGLNWHLFFALNKMKMLVVCSLHKTPFEFIWSRHLITKVKLILTQLAFISCSRFTFALIQIRAKTKNTNEAKFVSFDVCLCLTS